ncbi:MAG: response regulator [Acidobacteriota bacterium]|nr:MAG: response regulator [Acidobacteriota bacterium]
MSNKNLLVVDDSATTRMLISLTLKKEGTYTITEVADGKEAVDKLGDESVDCVLTDINMPHMNGLDLIAYIRAKHSEPTVPIIVITTQGEEKSRDEGLAKGANAYLTKPISGPKLVTLVKELLA